MKKFRFHLQAIRELREAEEQTAQREYGDAVRACEEVATRLLILDEDLRAAWQSMRNQSGLRVDELRHGRAWCCVLEEKQRQLAEELQQAQRKMDEAHAGLVSATRRREAMERLFQRHRRAYERSVMQEEQKFLDEVATRRAWQPELEAA